MIFTRLLVAAFVSVAIINSLGGDAQRVQTGSPNDGNTERKISNENVVESGPLIVVPLADNINVTINANIGNTERTLDNNVLRKAISIPGPNNTLINLTIIADTVNGGRTSSPGDRNSGGANQNNGVDNRNGNFDEGSRNSPASNTDDPSAGESNLQTNPNAGSDDQNPDNNLLQRIWSIFTYYYPRIVALTADESENGSATPEDNGGAPQVSDENAPVVSNGNARPGRNNKMMIKMNASSSQNSRYESRSSSSSQGMNAYMSTSSRGHSGNRRSSQGAQGQGSRNPNYVSGSRGGNSAVNFRGNSGGNGGQNVRIPNNSGGNGGQNIRVINNSGNSNGGNAGNDNFNSGNNFNGVDVNVPSDGQKRPDITEKVIITINTNAQQSSKEKVKTSSQNENLSVVVKTKTGGGGNGQSVNVGNGGQENSVSVGNAEGSVPDNSGSVDVSVNGGGSGPIEGGGGPDDLDYEDASGNVGGNAPSDGEVNPDVSNPGEIPGDVEGGGSYDGDVNPGGSIPAEVSGIVEIGDPDGGEIIPDDSNPGDGPGDVEGGGPDGGEVNPDDSNVEEVPGEAGNDAPDGGEVNPGDSNPNEIPGDDGDNGPDDGNRRPDDSNPDDVPGSEDGEVPDGGELNPDDSNPGDVPGNEGGNVPDDNNPNPDDVPDNGNSGQDIDITGDNSSNDQPNSEGVIVNPGSGGNSQKVIVKATTQRNTTEKIRTSAQQETVSVVVKSKTGGGGNGRPVNSGGQGVPGNNGGQGVPGNNGGQGNIESGPLPVDESDEALDDGSGPVPGNGGDSPDNNGGQEDPGNDASGPLPEDGTDQSPNDGSGPVPGDGEQSPDGGQGVPVNGGSGPVPGNGIDQGPDGGPGSVPGDEGQSPGNNGGQNVPGNTGTGGVPGDSGGQGDPGSPNTCGNSPSGVNRLPVQDNIIQIIISIIEQIYPDILAYINLPQNMNRIRQIVDMINPYTNNQNIMDMGTAWGITEQDVVQLVLMLIEQYAPQLITAVNTMENMVNDRGALSDNALQMLASSMDYMSSGSFPNTAMGNNFNAIMEITIRGGAPPGVNNVANPNQDMNVDVGVVALSGNGSTAVKLMNFFVESLIQTIISTINYEEIMSDPDIDATTPQLARRNGYTARPYRIVTEDGFILTHFRITRRGRQPQPSGRPRPVVILLSGVFLNSDNWLLLGRNSLPFLLIESGYDVWVLNSRGLDYSQGHTSLPLNGTAYWDHSWHEIGVYDLPATIDYILSTTGNSELSFVCYTLGCAGALVMLSERPQYNERISSLVGFAPLVFLHNMKTVNLSPFATPLFHYGVYFEDIDILSLTGPTIERIRRSCAEPGIFDFLCLPLLYYIYGWNNQEEPRSRAPVFLSHTGPFAIKQLVHSGQVSDSGRFRKFKHLSPILNQQDYGSQDPPDYNLQNVRVPVALFYGNLDPLGDEDDVLYLAQQLPNIQFTRKVPYYYFNYQSFAWGVDAPELVYRPTLEYIRNFTRF